SPEGSTRTMRQPASSGATVSASRSKNARSSGAGSSIFVEPESKVICTLQVSGLVYLRCAACVAAAAAKQHAPVAEAYVVDDGEAVIVLRLAEGPEVVVGAGHDKRAVAHGIALIAAERRVAVVLRQ